jgi:hypothetical protein
LATDCLCLNLHLSDLLFGGFKFEAQRVLVIDEIPLRVF